MNKTNWIAAVLFAAIFAGSFALGENSALFVNGLGLTLVLSGTLGAMFISYPVTDMIASVRVAHNAYNTNPPTPDEVVNALMDLSVRSRRKGTLALEEYEEETTVSFLKRALTMLVDDYKEDELRDILYTEMYYFRQRRRQHERVFLHASRLAPAFGVAGSVVGLIAMLSGIGDPDTILRTIPIALTSTLYGIVLGNFVLAPIAEAINTKTQNELMTQKLVTDGVIAIRAEQNTFRLARKLESFLTPAARSDAENGTTSFEEIRERVKRLQLEEEY